jgi:hypothetical protein
MYGNCNIKIIKYSYLTVGNTPFPGCRTSYLSDPPSWKQSALATRGHTQQTRAETFLADFYVT